jgi:hypothetical protein
VVHVALGPLALTVDGLEAVAGAAGENTGKLVVKP